ncbi:hypothetical protein [Acidocella sp.]|uniref:hypothetical protein n=1 Tax=Acidocella sp. TaxID=50710 RepID=UPI002610B215|nr:hypothetical protein [Acidocella sp.]
MAADLSALSNDLSAVISRYLEAGYHERAVLSCASAVIADYGRGLMGEAYLSDLSELIKSRADLPAREARHDASRS